MPSFAKYGKDCEKLLNRGLEKFEEATVYAEMGEEETAEQKVKDGKEDVLAVTNSIRTVAAVQKKGLDLDLINLGGSYATLAKGIEDLTKTETGRKLVEELKKAGLNLRF
ncbi:MAG: hypothetical protein GTN36_00860 [Candidatus Aenigmarchaeota archaeon]|nr:hypothetical protein [Candidatus Aenigmarchaeota archaeon]